MSTNTTTTTATTATTDDDALAALIGTTTATAAAEADAVTTATDDASTTAVTTATEDAVETIAAADEAIDAALVTATTADASTADGLIAAMRATGSVDAASSKRTAALALRVMIIAAMAVDARYTALVTTDKRVLPSGRTRSVYAAAGVFGPTPDADAAAFKATFGWGWGTITDMVDALRCAAYFASARADLIREADDTAFTPTAKSLIARARRMMADADPERGAKRIEARNKAVIDAETAKRDADALNKARPDVYAAIMATDEPIAVDNASGKVITAVGTVNEDALRGLRVMHAAGNVAGIAELIRLAQYAIANPWKPTVREEDAPTDDAATADAASANEADAAATPEEDAAPIVKAKRTRKPRAAA